MLAVALTGVLVAGGCSATSGPGSTSGAPASIDKRGLEATNTVVAPWARGRDLLGRRPDPVPGQVRVAGVRDPMLVRATRAHAGSGTQVVSRPEDAPGSFARLCSGAIDLVASVRPITTQEWSECQERGLGIVQLTIARQAVVLATGRAGDLGTDCLDLDDLGRLVAADPDAETWSDLRPGLARDPISVAGLGLDDAGVRAFARTVLGSSEPTREEVSGRYRAFADPEEVLAHVAGTPEDHALAADLARWESLRDRWRAELRAAWQERATRPASAPSVASIRRLGAEVRSVTARYRTAQSAARRLAATRGRVGLFDLGEYAAHRDLLRPLEIEVPLGGGPPRCVVPSLATVAAGDYPLARTLLLTASTRAVGRPEVADFLRHVLRSSAALSSSVGGVPLPETEVRKQLDWLIVGPLPRFGADHGGPVRLLDSAGAAEPLDAPPIDRPAR